MRKMLPLLCAGSSVALLGTVSPACAQNAGEAPAGAVVPAPPRQSLTLSSFGSAEDIARWARRGIDAAHFAPLEGGGGARLVFVPYVTGEVEWPALIFRTSRGLASDWSDYDVLAVDVRNTGASEFTLSYQIDDNAGNRKIVSFKVAPGTTQTLRLPLTDLGVVDSAQVREMQLFTTRPPAEMTAELRRLRLETDEALHQANRKRMTDGIHALFTSLRKKTRDSYALEFLGQQQKRSQTLEAQLRSAAERQEQNRLRRDLLAVTEPLEAAVQRRVAESRLRREFARLSPKSPYAVGFATSMEKVFPADRPFRATVARTTDIALAGNEKESVQLLVLAGQTELKDVQVQVGALTRTDGQATLPASGITVAPVGFVQTKRPTYRVNYIGWHPDPLLEFLDRVTVKAGEMQPFWIRVAAPAGTPPGVYQGKITVRPANGPPITCRLNVTVWGFDLTKETHLRTAVSLREDMLRKVHGDNMPEALRQRYYSFLMENRLNPDNIYRVAPPAIEDLELWNKQGMNAFNLTYVPRPQGLKPGGPFPADLKQQILDRLDSIIPRLKERGLYHKAYVYGFDEVRPDAFNAIREMMGAIREKYPDLLILTTAYDATYGEESKLPVSLVNGWVPLTPQYNPERAEAARKQGKQIWWYTCIGPQAPYANWLIEYDAIDARSLMGLQTAKYKPDGYLYYALDRWPLSEKPITFGPYTDWPSASYNRENGDGSVLCAGPNGPLSTIRLENIRDGIEDNEYFWLLREEIQKLKTIPGREAAAALRQAEQAERIGPDLVADLTHFSKSPAAIYAKRRTVAEAILAARRVTQGKTGGDSAP